MKQNLLTMKPCESCCDAGEQHLALDLQFRLGMSIFRWTQIVRSRSGLGSSPSKTVGIGSGADPISSGYGLSIPTGKQTHVETLSGDNQRGFPKIS